MANEDSRNERATPSSRPTGLANNSASGFLAFVGRQVLGPLQQERAVAPRVFSHATDLVPVAPVERWRLNNRKGGVVPLSSVIGAASGGGSLSNWRTVPWLTPRWRLIARADEICWCSAWAWAMPRVRRASRPIPFRVWVMLVGRRRRPTETAEQGRFTRSWWRGQRAPDVFDDLADGADHPARGVEQAQLMHRLRPNLGQNRRVQTRMVSDDLLGRRPQALEERLDHAWSTSFVFASKA
jgi:hypothetical protein